MEDNYQGLVSRYALGREEGATRWEKGKRKEKSVKERQEPVFYAFCNLLL